MEPEMKRIKFDKPSAASETRFLDLNDDCILTIFDQFPINDLCSMSFTCQRIQTLAFYHYQRLFPEKIIVIDVKKNRHKSIVFSDQQEKCVKYFSKCISNVRVNGGGVLIKRLFNFIESNCCSTLKTLEISTQARMYPSDGQIIKDQLEGLQSLVVRDLNSENDIHRVLLKHCKNLKNLKIDTKKDGNDKWLQQHYPKLETLNIQLNCNYLAAFADNAGQFFQNNPQIKDVSCSGCVVGKILSKNVIGIKRLAIKMDWMNLHLRGLLDDLQVYCQQKPFECLEFDFGDKLYTLDAILDGLTMLSDFNEIHPIHGLTINICGIIVHSRKKSEIIPVIVNLKHLRKLNLHISFIDMSLISNFMEVLAKEMVHLEDLEIMLFITQLEEALVLKTFLMPFISNAKQMKKLTLTFFTIGTKINKLNSNEFNDLAAIRSRISDACSIRILIVSSNIGYSDKPITLISDDYKLNLKMMGRRYNE